MEHTQNAKKLARILGGNGKETGKGEANRLQNEPRSFARITEKKILRNFGRKNCLFLVIFNLFI